MSNITKSKAAQAAGYYREVGPDHNARRIIDNLLAEYTTLQLESDREEIHRQIEIDRLLDERDRLREALKFYADGEWNERYPCGVWYDHDEAIIDFGQVAREALQEDDDG